MSVGLCALMMPWGFSELHPSSWTSCVPISVPRCPPYPLSPQAAVVKYFHRQHLPSGAGSSSTCGASEPRGQVGNVCFTLCNESHLLLSAVMVIDSVLTPWFVFRRLLPSLHLAAAISPLLSVISSLVALPPSWAAAAPRRGWGGVVY